ncbi:YibE/F family protein [Cellulomonas rhizosphaerae]|uniref:YibE/F family protein n=1 Tax=Cellulomonas rhizosphaerae TaxID=2293719 RepID=UPI001F402FCD|nr:YibE/F family protein [Cellulomonas rhizosphaerae]
MTVTTDPLPPEPQPPTARRARRAHGRGGRSAVTIALLAVVGAIVLAAALTLALTWPGHVTPSGQAAGLGDAGVQHVNAEVTGSSMQSCDASVENMLPDGTLPASVACLKVEARLTSGADEGRVVSVYATSGITKGDVPAGTRIIVEHYPAADGAPETWAWSDFSRGVPLGAFALAFVLVAAVVAGWRGLRAVAGLAVAFTVIWVYLLPALVAGKPALLVGLAASVIIITVALYLAHGPSLRTTTALGGTLAGLLLVAALGVLGAHAAHLSPVASEDDYRLAALIGDHGVQTLHGVFLCGVVLAGLGVLNDVTITQSSAVWELRAADPTASWQALFTGGMRIGRDHIASTIYTIAFAYAGASLPVLMVLQLYDLPLGQTLTSGIFAQEIIRTLAGSIGLILAIPLTTAIAVSVATRATTRQLTAQGGHAH